MRIENGGIAAIAQAYYAKQQGLRGVTTETGAGQWGTALSMACAYLGLDCKVYMVKCSYEQKPFRREVMRTYGASVTPSPSAETEIGRRILAEHPGTTGSLGCAISEAVEVATSTPGYRYVLGSVLNQVLLHQSVIGLEAKAALDKYGVKPDIIIGCAGGGSNLGGLISPFMGEKLRGERDYRFIAVEPASCPSLTRGRFAYDFCDTGMVCPLAKMYTLGSGFIPSPNHAGGLPGKAGLRTVARHAEQQQVEMRPQFLNARAPHTLWLNRLKACRREWTPWAFPAARVRSHVNPLVKISIGSSGTQRATAVPCCRNPETPWYSAAAAPLPSPQ